MATVDLGIEQVLLECLDESIKDTAELFLKNPWQFHGDTGIMHYLYYRVLCNGGRRLFHRAPPDGTDTLLFESEHYTKEVYLRKGKRESPGKLDFALLDPGSITREGRVRRGKRGLPAIAGIEVGLDKSVDEMGDMVAEQTARLVQPGDAAKLIRAIRFGRLRHGFLLEFYRDPASEGVARSVFDAVLAAGKDLAGLHVLVLVAGTGGTSPKACAYPEQWKARNRLEPYPEIKREASANQDVDLPFLERFQKHCGRGNLLLQAKLKELKKDHPHAVRLWYSRARLPKSMTVRRPEDPHAVLTRITTRLRAPETLCEIDPHLAQALSQGLFRFLVRASRDLWAFLLGEGRFPRHSHLSPEDPSQEGLPLVDGLLKIPDEGDLDFVSRVIRALKTTLGLSANDEGPPRAGTETTFWDSLEKLTGSIEAPQDWSAEHDHYLYGVPRRDEGGGE